MPIVLEAKRRVARVRNRVRDKLRLLADLYLARRQPIIVYSMGKVASSSIIRTAQKLDQGSVFQVHFMHPPHVQWAIDTYTQRGMPPEDHLQLGQRLYRRVILRKRPARFITLVRDPIARNVSSFFQNFELNTGVKYGEAPLSAREMLEHFHANYDDDYALTWFDQEIMPVLGIDVFAHPFPREKGYQCLNNGAFDLLIIKAEADDTVKAAALAEFLDVEPVALVQANVGAEKAYAAEYRDFKQALHFDPAYVDTLYQSKLVQHFYSAEEIAAMAARWTAEPASEQASPENSIVS